MARLGLQELLPHSPLSAHDQQALCDIPLLIWPASHPRRPPRRFSELAVFDARLDIRVRRIDEHVRQSLQETARSTKPKGGHPMIVRRSEYSNEM